MNRYLFNLVVSIVLMLVSAQAFSQVRLMDSGLTKFYDNGTRITYFEMGDFPNSVELREFVTKKVLEHPDVKRVTIFTDGTTFMYEALQNVEPTMIVDMTNDALAEYRSEFGDFPEPEIKAPVEQKSTSPNYTIREERGEVAPSTTLKVRKVEFGEIDRQTNASENYKSKQ
jgi:hypothetical protein